jgi:hypothetical protein
MGWNTTDTCATPDLCSKALQKCIDPSCNLNAYDCAGATLLVCNPGRTGFVQKETCASTDLCDKAQGQCDICTPGVFSCNRAELHQCDATGQTNPVVQTCSSVDRCQASGVVGNCLLCDLDEYRCSLNVLQKCAADRLGFADETDCGATGTCFVAATSHECVPVGMGGAPP